MLVPRMIVGTVVPTIIVITAYYWKSCDLVGALAGTASPLQQAPPIDISDRKQTPHLCLGIESETRCLCFRLSTLQSLIFSNYFVRHSMLRDLEELSLLKIEKVRAVLNESLKSFQHKNNTDIFGSLLDS